jgi:hypothetical protein
MKTLEDGPPVNADSDRTLAVVDQLLHSLNDFVTDVDRHLLIDGDAVQLIPLQDGVQPRFGNSPNLLTVNPCRLLDHRPRHKKSARGKLVAHLSDFLFVLAHDILHFASVSSTCKLARLLDGLTLIHCHQYTRASQCVWTK